MNPMVILGLSVGVLAVLFAGAVVVWAIRMAQKGMRSNPNPDAPVVDKETLQALLMKLNHAEHPFCIRTADDADLVIEWNIVDAKWIEVLGKGSERMTYQAWIVIDDSTKTVNYHERIYRSVFSAGGPQVSAESYASKGFELWGTRRGHRWGIRDDFSVGEIYNYKFTPSDVKGVVGQIVNDHGWAFQLTLIKPHLSRAKVQRQSSGDDLKTNHG